MCELVSCHSKCLTAEDFNQWQANLLKFEFNPFDGKSVYTMTNAEYDHITYFTSLSLHFLTTNNLTHILIKMTWEFMQPVIFFFFFFDFFNAFIHVKNHFFQCCAAYFVYFVRNLEFSGWIVS